MRQVQLLENGYAVTVVGFGYAPDANVKFIALDKPLAGRVQRSIWATKLFFRAFESYYWSLKQVGQANYLLGEKYFDFILANDVSTLPLALKLSQGNPVLLDAHEYSPREFEDKWLWKILFGPYYHYLCAHYLQKVSAMTTVCQGIADEYEHEYGISCEVVHNAPLDQKLTPSVVDDHRIRLVHHGATIRSRHLELMINMMKYLDSRFTLDFMLVETDITYLAELKTAAEVDPRISFIEPVEMQDICQRLNHFDVGVFLLPPVNFNYEHALPNKFFEFIQARLAVAIGPSPEMARLVRHYQCGVVAESFDPKSLAKEIDKLDSRKISKFKALSNEAAKELNFDRGAQILISEIERLI